MKKIINNKIYNTETATQINSWSCGQGQRDFRHEYEALFKTSKGSYFLYGEGGPLTKWRKTIGIREWMGSEDIVPMTREEAIQWFEEKCPEDTAIFEQEFGTVEEA